MIVAILVVSVLLMKHVEFIRNIFSMIERIGLFDTLDWLGSGMFGNFLPCIVLCLIGAMFFLASLRLVTVRVQSFPQTNMRLTGSMYHKYFFANSLLTATIRKEWRLIRREWHFFLDLFREIIVLCSLLAVILSEAWDGPGTAAPVLAIVMCAVMSSDLSWRIVAVERIPDLLSLSPVGIAPIMKGKLIAAIVPPLSVLIVLCLSLAFFDTRCAALAFLFGTFAISASALLNCRSKLLNGGGVMARRIKQSPHIVLAQAAVVFGWAMGFYFFLKYYAIPCAASIAVGIALPTINLLIQRRKYLSALTESKYRHKLERIARSTKESTD